MRGRPLRPTVPEVRGRSRSARRLEEDEKVGRGGELRGESRVWRGGEPGGRWGAGKSGGDAEGSDLGSWRAEKLRGPVVVRGCGRTGVGPCGRRPGV